MLTGIYERSLDEKGRLAIPRQLRSVFSDSGKEDVFLAPGNEGCVGLYSMEQFRQLADRLAAAASPGKADHRRFQRVFYSQAERVTGDSQGRIRIPDRLLTRAGISRETVVLGVSDHCEIWDPVRWNAFFEETASGFDELTATAFGT